MITPHQFKTIALAAAKSASEKKAEEILLLDLRKTEYGLSDFVLILNANSEVHLKTLRETIQETLEKFKLVSLHQDGIGSHQWTVLDYGGLIIHIFQKEAREFYSLERLLENAKRVPLSFKIKDEIKPKRFAQ